MAEGTFWVPDDDRCIAIGEEGKPIKKCAMLSYSRNLGAYNCRLHGRLLRGEKFPYKCAGCLATLKDAMEHE